MARWIGVPCPGIDACGPHYSNRCSTTAHDVGAALRTPWRCQGTPGGSIQSDAPRSHSARVSVEMSDDRECREIEGGGKHVAVAGIAVSSQIARCALPATCFCELIGDPLGGRMRRHAKPKDLSPAMVHDQQSIQQPERDGWHHEQAYPDDGIRMIPKKGLPSRRGRFTCSEPCTSRRWSAQYRSRA
jgi:hypothetical protein